MQGTIHLQAWTLEHREQICSLDRKFANQINDIARFFQIHRDGLIDILNDADGRDQQRGRNGMTQTICAEIFIVERVFAADEGRAIEQRRIVTAATGFDERAKRFRAKRIAPAEIIEHGNPIRVRADRDRVANGFIDHRPCHFVGIAFAIFGIDAIGEHNAFRSLSCQSV